MLQVRVLNFLASACPELEIQGDCTIGYGVNDGRITAKKRISDPRYRDICFSLTLARGNLDREIRI